MWTLSSLIFTLATLSSAHAGIFGSPCDELLWETNAMNARLKEWHQALDAERGPKAVEEIRRAVIGTPSDLPAAIGVSAPEDFEGTFGAYLSAFEALAGRGPVIEVFYQGNDSKGFITHRSGNPNIRLQVPTNFRDLVRESLMIYEDTTSGHQIFVISALEDEQGQPVSTYLVNQPGVFHADIREINVTGDVSSEDRNTLKALKDVDHWGLLENVRPAQVLQWTDKSVGFAMRLVWAANQAPLQTFLNLQRFVVKNDQHGSDFTVNAAFWYANTPIIDAYARPLNLWSATRNRSEEGDASFEDQLAQMQTADDAAAYALSAYNDSVEVGELIHAAFRDSLLYERVDYLGELWKIVEDHNRVRRMQEAKDLFRDTLLGERSQFDFDNLMKNLKWTGDYAAGVEQQLADAVAAATTKLADPNCAPEVKSALMARKAELDRQKADMSQIQVEVQTWQTNIQNFLGLASRVSSDFFGRTTEADSRRDVKDIKADVPVVGEFGEALTNLRGDLNSFEKAYAQSPAH